MRKPVEQARDLICNKEKNQEEIRNSFCDPGSSRTTENEVSINIALDLSGNLCRLQFPLSSLWVVGIHREKYHSSESDLYAQIHT